MKQRHASTFNYQLAVLAQKFLNSYCVATVDLFDANRIRKFNAETAADPRRPACFSSRSTAPKKRSCTRQPRCFVHAEYSQELFEIHPTLYPLWVAFQQRPGDEIENPILPPLKLLQSRMNSMLNHSDE